MQRYFATFPAGTFDIIVRDLKSFKVDQFKIEQHDDSSISFQSSLTVEHLIELRYFTNIFVVIDKFSNLPKALIKDKYFRLMRLEHGEPQALNPADKQKLESNIKSVLGLEPNTHLARNDFYVIERENDLELLGLRLPKAKFKREKLMPGELRPELAHILCMTAGLKAKQKLLDPFAGYGAIPFEALRGFGCKDIIAIDSQQLAKRHKHPNIDWHQADASKLSFIADKSIDRVVTDPPWGVYDPGIDLEELYTDTAQEIKRILDSQGVAVILTGYDQAAKIMQLAGFKILGQWPVLVSGQKATIYKLQPAG